MSSEGATISFAPLPGGKLADRLCNRVARRRLSSLRLKSTATTVGREATNHGRDGSHDNHEGEYADGVDGKRSVVVLRLRWSYPTLVGWARPSKHHATWPNYRDRTRGG